MNQSKLPKLRKGMQVAIIATAGVCNKDYILSAGNLLESWGLVPIYGKNILNRHHQFAGTDDERLQDFQEALDNPEIFAIWFARGGYGSIRIADQIDWSTFLKSPKWMIGFSDITIFHNQLAKLAIPSLHSFMPINLVSLDSKDEMLEDLHDLLFEHKWVTCEGSVRKGLAVEFIAPIVGGNLSILYSLLGTPFELDTQGKILFLEDVGEHLYHLDRMMNSFKLAGKLKGIQALLVGGFTEMKDNKRPFGKSYLEIIRSYLPEDLPIIAGFPAGHQSNNIPIPFGMPCKLNIYDGKFELKLTNG